MINLDNKILPKSHENKDNKLTHPSLPGIQNSDT